MGNGKPLTLGRSAMDVIDEHINKKLKMLKLCNEFIDGIIPNENDDPTLNKLKEEDLDEMIDELEKLTS